MLQTSQVQKEINSVNTEILVQRFADRILVLVTQLGKVGSLVCVLSRPIILRVDSPVYQKVQVTLPSNASLASDEPQDNEMLTATTSPYRPLPPPPVSIELTPLFGSAPTVDEKPLYDLYASQIATVVWIVEGGSEAIGSILQPVIVGLALKRTGDCRDINSGMFHGIIDLLRDALSQGRP